MRPLRLLVSLCGSVVLITLLLYTTVPSQHDHLSTSSQQKGGRMNALFSFHAPSSLFQPSAIISLTDDNSTFFLARPAAFGPLLPSKGLSAPLWIGSGFGDDSLGRGGVAASSEGELGCSDVPGWHGAGRVVPRRIRRGGVDGSGRSRSSEYGSGSEAERLSFKQAEGEYVTDDDEYTEGDTEDDGTDDYRNQPASWSSASVKKGAERPTPDHADIQSLQESAEIAGKVVLLSRGGCGFLEKVKWAQRRGGTAVIVGDDIRGGPLVTMYARGDTSNITIPSLFTSHTTAHLLSSLIPSGGNIEGEKPDEARRAKGLGLGSSGGDGSEREGTVYKPTASADSDRAQPTSTSHSLPGHGGTGGSQYGFFRSLLSFFGLGRSVGYYGDDSRRPPSSGNIGWVQEDWDNARRPMAQSSEDSDGTQRTASTTPPADDFVIGVHDWRDPDLIGSDDTQDTSSGSSRSSDQIYTDRGGYGNPRAGSSYPGSGEYDHTHRDSNRGTQAFGSSMDGTPAEDGAQDKDHSEGWWSHLRWTKGVGRDGDDLTSVSTESSSPLDTVDTRHGVSKPDFPAYSPSEPHDGLWVTLSPTSTSSSPFFDTLLVLVVSPLVTLTVVYALLLLRSRIRRRRWRAPKSVVDRLPVRTYHTLPSVATSAEASAAASGLATPVAPNVTTPLLQRQPSTSSGRPVPRARPANTILSPRARPRSRTVSEVATPASSTLTTADEDDALIRPRSRDTASSVTTTASEQEKRDAGLAEWRRRYGGRQRECVVCLEEYVDGVSRVMSLPCGHEFHAECITPWLTTRRRTCPICKGDVVRSLAGHHPNHDGSPHSSSLPSSTSIASTSTSSSATATQVTAPQPASPSSSSPSRYFSPFSSLSGVVGSGGGSPSHAAASPTPNPDAIQDHVAAARNDGPHASSPVPIAYRFADDDEDDDEALADLERGDDGVDDERSGAGAGAVGPGSWIRSLFGGSSPSARRRELGFVDRTR